MQKLYKIIPMVMACILGAVIFYTLGADQSHMAKKDLEKLQAANPKMQVARIDQGTLVQFEVYGKLTDHKYRVQALRPGNAIFYNANGKQILKMDLEPGDVVVTVPKQEVVDVIAFRPFDWVE